MHFLVTIPQIELNIVLSPLHDRANMVPSYLASDSAEYISQSPSRSGEYNSWLPFD